MTARRSLKIPQPHTPHPDQNVRMKFRSDRLEENVCKRSVITAPTGKGGRGRRGVYEDVSSGATYNGFHQNTRGYKLTRRFLRKIRICASPAVGLTLYSANVSHVLERSARRCSRTHESRRRRCIRSISGPIRAKSASSVCYYTKLLIVYNVSGRSVGRSAEGIACHASIRRI